MLAKSLRKGDTIGIIAPSNKITQDNKYLLDNAIKKFESLGLKVVYSKNCFNFDKYNVSGGEPQERADDLNEMFLNPQIKAIYCAQGGDTVNQILSLIDYELIKKNPKILLGMSDIDVLHLAINKKTGLIVFHGSDPKSGRDLDLDFEYTWTSFQDRMMHRSKEIPASSERKCVRKGIAEGKIIGCNLSSILKLAGTPYFPDFQNSILFLEGYSENTKKAIAKLQQLKEIGVFDKIKGIVIGYVLGFQDKDWIKENNIESNYEDIVLDITKDYNFPILKTNDFGHKCPNCYLPIGAKIKLDAQEKEITIIEDFLI
ncbi:LD-carboxypeptidase [Candidatus Gracilibacteria bacterium]|nr:LD-carboxypeptidase [Candidatus Gracilibacteria bacterium]